MVIHPNLHVMFCCDNLFLPKNTNVLSDQAKRTVYRCHGSTVMIVLTVNWGTTSGCISVQFEM
jgi:hypothetical protein